MSEKTKYSGTISWLNALCIVMIVLFIAWYFSFLLLFSPITPAVGISMVQSINVFGDGTVGTDPFWRERLYILRSIVLFFVVGPALWMMDSKSDSNSKGVFWYAGVALIMIGFISVGMGITNYGFLTGDQWNGAERSRNIDEVRAELNTLQNRAMELYWLPAEQGGADGELSAIALADLKQGDTFENTYLLKKSAPDSTLTIYGIGRRSGEDPNFQNANGEQGKIQLAVQLKPQDLETDWLRADSLKN